MCFSIFLRSAFLSIIMKCWDLENVQRTCEMKLNYSSITSFCIQYCIKKLVLNDFLFHLFQIVRALKVASNFFTFYIYQSYLCFAGRTYSH